MGYLVPRISVLIALVTTAPMLGCARQHAVDSTREQRDASSEGSSLVLVLDAGPRTGAESGTLEPDVAAAAAHAVVPEPAASVVMPPPLPRTAAPPSTPPVATPGAARTAMPVVPPGRTDPVMVPAQTPPGVPARPALDGGKR